MFVTTFSTVQPKQYALQPTNGLWKEKSFKNSIFLDAPASLVMKLSVFSVIDTFQICSKSNMYTQYSKCSKYGKYSKCSKYS